MEISISHPDEQIRWLWLLAAGLPPILCFAAYALRLRRHAGARRWDLTLLGATVAPVILSVTFLVIEPAARDDLRGALSTFLMVAAVSAAPILISSELLRRFDARAGTARALRYSAVAVGSFVVGLALTVGALFALSIGLADF
jgi:hypothetical protein